MCLHLKSYIILSLSRILIDSTLYSWSDIFVGYRVPCHTSLRTWHLIWYSLIRDIRALCIKMYTAWKKVSLDGSSCKKEHRFENIFDTYFKNLYMFFKSLHRDRNKIDKLDAIYLFLYIITNKLVLWEM